MSSLISLVFVTLLAWFPLCLFSYDYNEFGQSLLNNSGCAGSNGGLVLLQPSMGQEFPPGTLKVPIRVDKHNDEVGGYLCIVLDFETYASCVEWGSESLEVSLKRSGLHYISIFHSPKPRLNISSNPPCAASYYYVKHANVSMRSLAYVPTFSDSKDVANDLLFQRVATVSTTREGILHLASEIAKTQTLSKVENFNVNVKGTDLNLKNLVDENVLSSKGRIEAEGSFPVEAVQLTKGAIGCALAHAKIWNVSVQGNENILVLEDDVRISPNFDRVVSVLKPCGDFSLIYLGTQPYTLSDTNSVPYELHDLDLPSPTSVRRITNGNYGTFAYIISPKGAKQLLSRFFPITQQVDAHIVQYTKENQASFLSLVVEPVLVTEVKMMRESTVQRYKQPNI